MSQDRNDPSADERWNAGCDFAMMQLCAALGVDPQSVTWDAATETLDGDVQAVIGNIMRAKYGDEWSRGATIAAKAYTETRNAIAAVREKRLAEVIEQRTVLLNALEAIRDGLADTGSGRSTGQRMTLINKERAHRIAVAAIAAITNQDQQP